MKTNDIYNRINDLDDAVLSKIIQRLEFRDSDPTFTQWREAYLEKLPLTTAEHILDVGCGTGVVTRAIANRPNVSAKIIGSDYSPDLIAAAKEKAIEHNVSNQVEFQVGDIHTLEFEDDTFDVVIAHTVMSHVTDPTQAIKELGRVLKPDGMLAIFDGDYASITFAAPDDEFTTRVEAAFTKIVAHNPRIMRKLPQILSQTNLKVVDVNSHVLPEIGKAKFWMSALETYAPMIKTLPEKERDDWLKWQRHANETEQFFGVCNYYTYLISSLSG